jgi:hypothetical protein
MSVRIKTAIQSGVIIFPVLFLLLPGSIVVSIITTRRSFPLGHLERLARHNNWLWSAESLKSAYQDCTLGRVFTVFGGGSGMLLSGVKFGIQAISKSEDCGRAACTYSFVRLMGMSIGVAISPCFYSMIL